MLADLRIENLAVVEHASAEFSPGLNVISGETGAGKTILLQALSLALGARAHSDMVRAGADAALVEGRFELDSKTRERVEQRLGKMGLPSAGDELVVRRKVTAQGKSRAYINDASATAKALQTVCQGLVDLTGQHDQYGLLRTDRQLDLLDAYAKVEPLCYEMAVRVEEMRAAEEQWEQLRSALANRAERGEFLRFYLKEFKQIGPEPGEDELLKEEAAQLVNNDKLNRQIAQTMLVLYEGEHSAFDSVATGLNCLQPFAATQPQVSETVDQLEQIQSMLDDTCRELSALTRADFGDSSRLEQVESRLLDIQRLCRKHGISLDELIEKMEAAEEELERLEQLERLIDEAEVAVGENRAKALAVAEKLSKRRSAAISALVQSTMEHIVELGFARARFQIDQTTVEGTEELGPKGKDRIAFLLSTSPDEQAKPLAKVASGGELSRILLALKCSFSQADPVSIHVFDEVDSGIGGAAAEIVGRKIRQLADASQVLCVTHLPQIASFADRHLVVVKNDGPDGTHTHLQQLAAGARTDEVARMLGGTEITKTTKAHAREMLRRAQVTN